ncbi:CHC2 zinc finger domain-containing protein [Dawidia soli]|uniref:Zinc finger CHC2-type domain-containing protein n=1 Tax=Dawidia soli TaxID=2782352 RepID=A0AAP2DCY2_9BACT|nr:CHC2 zinc finger domain-containing protein [Dawidia soli]MBT1689866.1 hypothetical protein [Dawidia soli]
MKFEQAKAIPLSEILAKLGISPEKQYGDEIQYLSPFRQEKTPSFYVNAKKNSWYDHGPGIGGGVIQFIEELLKSQGVDNTSHDVSRWLDTIIGGTYAPGLLPVYSREPSPPKFIIKKISQIEEVGLVNYLRK